VSARQDAKVRVLIVDDSAIARDLIERGLSRDEGILVAGKSQDAYDARDKIVLLKPDVITLDVEMPRMDGIEFLKRLLPQYPLPVVIVSGVTPEGSRHALEALEAGAVAVVAKPRANDGEGLSAMLAELAEAIKDAARADMSKMRRSAIVAKASREEAAKRLPGSASGSASGAAPGLRRAPASPPSGGARAEEPRIVAIGASTGGTTALSTMVPAFPPTMPGTIIVQHMPPVFTRMFAESLDRISQVEVREAQNGDLLRPGLVLVAPGDVHVRVARRGSSFAVVCVPGPKVSGHRPSVDVLFSSVAEAAGDAAVGFLMTGMGRDGAAGLLAMRRAGARCLAQDEESSVVFGMPKEAWELGAAEKLVGLDRAVDQILACLRKAPAGGRA
jgi:two-component system, chemotaxis family, protein-glutamate methylesterase/glutaminase